LNQLVTSFASQSGVATIIFNRNEVANAINTAMWQAIPALLTNLEEQGARVIIFSGEGKYFAAGADFEDLKTIDNYAGAETFWLAIATALDAIAACALPTIAMVNGHCFGGGCLLANACDFRFAAQRALFSIPVAKLGIILDQVNIERLVNLVGLAEAKQLLFSADTISSAQAQAIGLVNRTVADENLTAETMIFAHSMARNSSLSIKAIKAALTRLEGGRSDGRDLLSNQERVIEGYLSADFRQRLRANS